MVGLDKYEKLLELELSQFDQRLSCLGGGLSPRNGKPGAVGAGAKGAGIDSKGGGPRTAGGSDNDGATVTFGSDRRINFRVAPNSPRATARGTTMAPQDGGGHFSSGSASAPNIPQAGTRALGIPRNQSGGKQTTSAPNPPQAGSRLLGTSRSARLGELAKPRMSVAPGSGKILSKAEVEEKARAIMDICDKFAHNGRITFTELDAFLPSSKYQHFLKYLRSNNRFRKHDMDKNGDLDMEELERAVLEYYRTGGGNPPMCNIREEGARATDREAGAVQRKPGGGTSSNAPKTVIRKARQDTRAALTGVEKKTLPASGRDVDAIAKKMSADILHAANKHSTDGSVSVMELHTFLMEADHKDFLSWLMRPQRFRTYDKDNSYSLDLQELQRAVTDYCTAALETEETGRPPDAVYHVDIEAALKQVIEICRKRSKQANDVRITREGLQNLSSHALYGSFGQWLSAPRKFRKFASDACHLNTGELREALQAYYEISYSGSVRRGMENVNAVCPEAGLAKALSLMELPWNDVPMAPQIPMPPQVDFHTLFGNIAPWRPCARSSQSMNTYSDIDDTSCAGVSPAIDTGG